MKVIDCEQYSPEWVSARAGVPTASNFDRIVDTSGKRSKQRDKYLYQLAGESITGKIENTYQNAAMLRGLEMEAEARQFYELTNDVTVQQVGFCMDTMAGCSPDGLVGEDGGLEIKCPLMATHVSYLLKGELPLDYYQQVQGSLFVTGRKWWDFLSYYPGMKPLVVRVKPDAQFQKSLRIELELFCAELESVVERIK